MDIFTIFLFGFIIPCIIVIPIVIIYETRLRRICKKICKYPFEYGCRKPRKFSFMGKEFVVSTKEEKFGNDLSEITVYINDNLVLTIDALEVSYNKYRITFKTNKVNEEQLIKVLKECKSNYWKCAVADIEERLKTSDLY